ncbi:MAG: C-terminal helicase domain-containing protein [Bacteroidetes bacterium]|nr:C-terminal helicase domain-containing protein [Bacteroidota bacterium]
MLGSNQLVKPEEGIFLGETWRMHPTLCEYVSARFYEGRLFPHPDTALQSILAQSMPHSGAYLVPVDHQEPRMQECEEEGRALQIVIDHLLSGSWTDRHGDTKPMDPEDIIVIAPFNSQVNMLRKMLPDTIRVGTVDKFQGQQAAVALVTMTSTSTEEAPKGMDFLLSRERINVALSRGKALSLVFASPRLLNQVVGQHIRFG